MTAVPATRAVRAFHRHGLADRLLTTAQAQDNVETAHPAVTYEDEGGRPHRIDSGYSDACLRQVWHLFRARLTQARPRRLLKSRTAATAFTDIDIGEHAGI